MSRYHARRHRRVNGSESRLPPGASPGSGGTDCAAAGAGRRPGSRSAAAWPRYGSPLATPTNARAPKFRFDPRGRRAVASTCAPKVEGIQIGPAGRGETIAVIRQPGADRALDRELPLGTLGGHAAKALQLHGADLIVEARIEVAEIVGGDPFQPEAPAPGRTEGQVLATGPRDLGADAVAPLDLEDIQRLGRVRAPAASPGSWFGKRNRRPEHRHPTPTRSPRSPAPRSARSGPGNRSCSSRRG